MYVLCYLYYRFFGYFVEQVVGEDRCRHVNLLYYLQDDTLCLIGKDSAFFNS